LAPGIIKSDWTPAEDLTLIEKHHQLGNHWSHIRLFLPGRQPIAVKNRWQWLCRRNIPNHSFEFTGFVRANWTNEGLKSEIIWAFDDKKHEMEIEFGDGADAAAFAVSF
jgi:hypothetical protein